MNETKTMGLRLPVQAAVDRSATYATLAERQRRRSLTGLAESFQFAVGRGWTNPVACVTCTGWARVRSAAFMDQRRNQVR